MSIEVFGEMVNLTTITSNNLDQTLGKFYAESTPEQSTKRKTEMTTECDLEDNINSYKASRFIQRVTRPKPASYFVFNLVIN